VLDACQVLLTTPSSSSSAATKGAPDGLTIREPASLAGPGTNSSPSGGSSAAASAKPAGASDALRATQKLRATDTRKLAPIQPPPPPVAVVAAVSNQSPSQARWLSQMLVIITLVVGSVVLAATALVFSYERSRRKRLGEARPLGEDSPEFAKALVRGKSPLAPNPRGVVRFTNSARFLYQILRSAKGAPSSGWETEFIDSVRARWRGDGHSMHPDWLQRELSRWMPALGSRPSPGGATRPSSDKAPP
jgi:hypothetical protein